MTSNVVFFAWNRSIPGRERLSAAHFQDFVQYLSAEQAKGGIDSYEVVFLNPHGGDLNGFFLIRGEPAKLDILVGSAEWSTHMTRASLHLEGSGEVRGVTGAAVLQRMDVWTQLIPE
jgi:hypothetical protein